MARVVREIMNPELFSVTTEAPAEGTLEAILAYGITAVPVLDDDRRPVGVISLRDLARPHDAHPLSSPALSVPMDVTIEEAARTMAEAGVHHLVVVGADGRAAGMISSLDLVRALVGLPSSHPATFPHFDPELELTWDDPQVFDAEHVDAAPLEAGVLVLSAGGVQRSESDLWVETAGSLRLRLREMLGSCPREAPVLACILARRDLRFRCARLSDPALRARVARRLRARIEEAPLPRDASSVAEMAVCMQ